MENQEYNCPCCSGKIYDECCGPFHKGLLPDNALKLMRSRYSAYALNLPDYIIKTTHPANPRYEDDHVLWAEKISDFSRHTQFEKLQILDFKEHGNLATVTFVAHLFQNQQDVTYTERSYFEKWKGKWLYRSGQIAEGHAPHLVTTEHLKILPIAYYGEAILREIADPIVEITEDILKLIEEMIETMDACDGIGLAAPQVKHSMKIFVIRVPTQVEEGKIQGGEVKVFINPELSLPSIETWKEMEGCLSIPTIRAEVERPKEITVEYTNLKNFRTKERVSGWEARVIMHENDHINGLLFIDRLENEEREKLLPGA